jgi:hypothetical protein
VRAGNCLILGAEQIPAVELSENSLGLLCHLATVAADCVQKGPR